MNYQNKTSEELINELKILNLEYDRLKSSYKKDILDRKQADEKLLLSDEKFRKAFLTSPDSININRLEDGMYVSINNGFTRITGYQEEEVIDKTSLELNIWADLNDRDKLVGILREKGEVQNLETKFLMKNGSVKNGMMSATIIHLEGIPHILSITRDITEKKYAENALKESETKYRELIELAVDGILLCSSDGTIISANSYINNLIGSSLADLLGMHINELFNPEDLQNVPIRFDLLQKGETIINERNILRSDGKRVPVEMHTKMMPDRTYQSIFHDITDRKESEKALRESEEKYRRIFENVQDLFYETSLDGTILEVSPSIESLSNGSYRREELIGKSIYDFYSDPNERSTLLFHLKERGTVTDFEITLENGDGSRIPCSLSSKILFDSLGRPEKIIGSIHDITERKNASDALRLAKEKAEASDRLKTEFLNNISHEVRTPLNGILGFAEIVSHHDISEEEKKESLTMLFESSDRLIKTITNYMDISMITSGSIYVNKKDFIPVHILREIFNNFESVCLNRELKLFLKIPEQSEELCINSDQEIFRKIISHFLDNAVKFTESGSINFGFKPKRGNLEFFVKDTGIGINPDSFNSIFDRFVKEGQGQYKVTEGSGLGLSIAQGMAQAIGGKIRLESESGIGSCFFLTIPINKDAEVSVSKIPDNDFTVVLDDSMILIAEDDETNFYYINAILSRATGAKVLLATNGREAIEIFKANPSVRLILMDIKMPEIDGFEATRQIKLVDRNVCIIAITAYAMSGDEEKIIAAGCDGYLSKPINKKSLLEKIAEFFNL